MFLVNIDYKNNYLKVIVRLVAEREIIKFKDMHAFTMGKLDCLYYNIM